VSGPLQQSVVVQKYGGSSVADLDKIKAVAARIVATRDAGHQVVAVVSAMGNTTNELLGLARQLSPAPGRRELDMLISVGERISMALVSMAVNDLGAPAVSFTGSQSGIITDESHSAAQIVAVRPQRIQDALQAGNVVIVAGFQGVSRDKEVTTLGRGGTDLSAVALAAALKAEWCEICSDVDGIYTADPRQVSAAKRMDTLSVDEVLAMARQGAKVLQADAVALAKRLGIELLATRTSGGDGGTRIQVPPLPPRVSGITIDEQLEVFASQDTTALFQELVQAGAPIRSVSPGLITVDLRNWHDRAAFVPTSGHSQGPTCQVSAAMCHVQVDGVLTLEALNALRIAGIRLLSWQASGESMVFRVPADQAQAAAEALHTALIGDSLQGG
jgi:aspartate kinase